LPLDRGRALWSLHVAPLLEDGSLGLVMKAHHAMVDGKSAVELALLLLDLSPDAPEAQADDWVPQPAPSSARLALDAMVDTGGESLRAAAGFARTVTSPRLAGTLRRAALAVGEDLLRPAPASYVNAPLTAQRILLHHTHAIEPLIEAKTKLGVTLNDVALTAVSGALRELATRAGERPRPLKAMVPVSTRAPEQAADLGNQISFVFVDLPCQEPDPVLRLGHVMHEMGKRKRGGQPEGADRVLKALGFAPRPLQHALSHMVASPRAFNLTVSNIPGPPAPLYMLGCELEEVYPVVPITDRHALSIGMTTLRDQAFFGIYAGCDALPDADRIGDLLNESIDELVSLTSA